MKNKITYLPIGILTSMTVLSGAALLNSGALATTADATVTVGVACYFTTSNYTSSISGDAGRIFTTESDTSKPTASITCTDPSGFVVQARGENGSTVLAGANPSSGSIATGTNTSGSSSWGFKVTSTSGTRDLAYASGTAYYAVPSVATPIISFTGSSSAAVVGTFRTDYQVYVAPVQPADTYSGGVEYTVVPNS